MAQFGCPQGRTLGGDSAHPLLGQPTVSSLPPPLYHLAWSQQPKGFWMLNRLPQAWGVGRPRGAGHTQRQGGAQGPGLSEQAWVGG